MGVTGDYMGDVPDSELEKIARALLPFNNKELTEFQQIVFEKLRKGEQTKFMKLPPEDRDKYVLSYLAKKL